MAASGDYSEQRQQLVNGTFLQVELTRAESLINVARSKDWRWSFSKW
jgi:hypothetical protein